MRGVCVVYVLKYFNLLVLGNRISKVLGKEIGLIEVIGVRKGKGFKRD